MPHRNPLTLSVAALALAGGALLVPALLVPSAAVASSSGDQAAARPAGHGRHHLLAPAQRKELRRTGHVTVRQAGKHHGATIVVQRGKVLSVTPTSIEVISTDGFTHSYVITERTKVREHGKHGAPVNLVVGQRVLVIAVHTASGDVARRITGLPAAATSATS